MLKHFCELSQKVWRFDFQRSVSDLVREFIEELNVEYCRHFPLITKNIGAKRINKPWITSAILKSIRTKSIYFKLCKLGIISEEKNKAYKNKLTLVIRKAKERYYKNCFDDFRSNCSRTWRLIRRLMNREDKRRAVKSLVVDGVKVNDALSVAECFADYFSNVAVNLDKSIPENNNSPTQYINHDMLSSMFLRPVTKYECSKVIMDLKCTKSDINVISVEMLKKNSRIYF